MFGICEKLWMTPRSRLSLRQGVGTILLVLGLLFWMLAVVFPLTVLHVRLLASLDHPEKLSLAVVAGGASLVGGIIFLLAPRRRRPRRSDERRSLADGPSQPPATWGHRAASQVPTTVSLGSHHAMILRLTTRSRDENQEAGLMAVEKGQGAATPITPALARPIICRSDRLCLARGWMDDAGLAGWRLRCSRSRCTLRLPSALGYGRRASKQFYGSDCGWAPIDRR